jgi:hypothetical protein
LLPYCCGCPRLLNIDAKKWSLDRRPQNPSIHRRWYPTFHLEMGALRPPVVTFQRGQVLVGVRAVSQAVHLLGILCGSALLVHNGSKLRI